MFPRDFSAPRHYTAHASGSPLHEISTSTGKPPPLHSFISSTSVSFPCQGSRISRLASYIILQFPAPTLTSGQSQGHYFLWPCDDLTLHVRSIWGPSLRIGLLKAQGKTPELKAGSPAWVLVPALLSDLGQVISHIPCYSESPSTKQE